jgi:hypothetical protein
METCIVTEVPILQTISAVEKRELSRNYWYET